MDARRRAIPANHIERQRTFILCECECECEYEYEYECDRDSVGGGELQETTRRKKKEKRRRKEVRRIHLQTSRHAHDSGRRKTERRKDAKVETEKQME